MCAALRLENESGWTEPESRRGGYGKTMFELYGNRIRMTQGDTGILTMLAGESGHVFTDADRAVFTVRRQSGALAAEMMLTPEADGTVQIPFTNGLTEGLEPGSYKWDVRYVLGAVMDNGRVVDGAEVITPMLPGTLTIVEAVGRI